MAKSQSDSQIAFVKDRVDYLNQVAPVTARAMFGGYGLYAEGVMFALIATDRLYFKVDDQNRDDFLSVGGEPFIYDRKGKPAQMSYYSLPDDIFNDLAQLVIWVESARAAARRSRSKTTKKQKLNQFQFRED
jgi:DNA transformation protein